MKPAVLDCDCVEKPSPANGLAADVAAASASERLQIRVHGDSRLPTLIYLPGLHGDWTLVASFRTALARRVRFVEFTYPRTLEWSIQDYARSLENALLEQGISRGWLLAESFGSQLAWPLLDKTSSGSFKAEGLILASGFVKHPWRWGPGTLRWLGGRLTMTSFRALLRIYGWYSRFRHRLAPETLQGVNEFVSRRTALDREAIRHRLRLLEHNDPRPGARQVSVPIYYLAGLVDPLVPWPLVRRWLGKNCPSYRGGRTMWFADHNVLATQPARAAEQVLRWMNQS